MTTPNDRNIARAVASLITQTGASVMGRASLAMNTQPVHTARGPRICVV